MRKSNINGKNYKSSMSADLRYGECIFFMALSHYAIILGSFGEGYRGAEAWYTTSSFSNFSGQNHFLIKEQTDRHHSTLCYRNSQGSNWDIRQRSIN